MPLSIRHKQQRAKNFALLFVLVAIMAVIFGVTLLKMS
jgi:predicted nucleic acid-binding Zn ribbon protein